MKLLFLLILSLCIVNCTGQATRTWKGAGFTAGTGDATLNNSSNWSGSGALLNSDNLVITLDDNPTIALTLISDLTVRSLTINGAGAKVGSGGNTFTIDLGNYKLSILSNCSITNSSKPPGSQSDRPFDMVITNSSLGVFNVVGNFTTTNENISFSPNSIQYRINGTMTVGGSTLANTSNAFTNSTIGFLIGSFPAKITFNGNVTLDDNTSASANTIFLGSISNASNGSVEFKSNLSLGKIASTNAFFTAATVIFDGAGTQTFTHGNSNYYFTLPHVIIGNNNNPTVLFASANSVTPNNLIGNLTINGTSTLDLNSLQWNRQSNGGTFLLKNSATLKLGSDTSLSNGSTATLIKGSNFPSGFATVTLDSATTVEFNKSTAQRIPKPTSLTTYGNLKLSGGSIKTFGGDMSITRTLSIAANTTAALDTCVITLKSDSKTTANVAEVLGSVTYGTGRFIIERYLQAASSWRLIATPVDSITTISNSWRESQAIATNTATGYGTRITGPSGMDEYTQRASMKWFNAATNSYVDIKSADLSKPIFRNEGYYIFVRGDRGVAVNGTTGATVLRIKGKIRTGDQTFSVTKNVAPATGFQSIGNPFASQIDVRNFIKISAGVSESFYIWNPIGGFYGVGQFELYSLYGGNFRRNGSPVGTILNTIESGQAVFLQNNSTTANGSIIIKESHKTSGSSLVSRPGVASPTLEINLFARDNAANETLVDGASIYFDENYSSEIDNYDVRKITNTYDNVGIKQGTANLAVERRKTLSENDTIRLNITGMRVADYKFEIDPSVLGNTSLTAFLIDKFLQTETELSLTDLTYVNFTTTQDAASRVANRFIIVFRIGAITNFTTISANRNLDKTVTVKWGVQNELNITNYELQQSNDGVNFTSIVSRPASLNNGTDPTFEVRDASASTSKNWYRIKAIKATGSNFYSAIAMVNEFKELQITLAPTIIISPNPIVGGKVNIYFQVQNIGLYDISIINMLGQVIQTGTAEVSSNNMSQTISFATAIKGTHLLRINNEKGETTVIPFVAN